MRKVNLQQGTIEKFKEQFPTIIEGSKDFFWISEKSCQSPFSLCLLFQEFSGCCQESTTIKEKKNDIVFGGCNFDFFVFYLKFREFENFSIEWIFFRVEKLENKIFERLKFFSLLNLKVHAKKKTWKKKKRFNLCRKRVQIDKFHIFHFLKSKQNVWKIRTFSFLKKHAFLLSNSKLDIFFSLVFFFACFFFFRKNALQFEI